MDASAWVALASHGYRYGGEVPGTGKHTAVQDTDWIRYKIQRGTGGTVKLAAVVPDPGRCAVIRGAARYQSHRLSQ